MGRPKNIIIINKNYQQQAEIFYRYLLKMGYNPIGCKSKYYYISEFLNWLERKGLLDITKITSLEINQYYRYISERPSRKDGGLLSPKTTHGHIRIIRDFFIMLQNENQVKSNPCSTLSFPYPKENEEREILTQQEIKQLYHVTKSAQERAILSLAYGCGLRVSELVKCNIEDIRYEEKILIIPDGKNKKRRVVPISLGVIKDLSEYYNNERNNFIKGRLYNPNESAFMLNSRGGRMRNHTYNKYLKIIINRTENKTIKNKKITIHNLRHSIASHLLEQGIPIEQVRMFLGHAQLETTQLYTHINQKQIENII